MINRLHFNRFKNYYRKNRLIILGVFLSWLLLSILTSQTSVMLYHLEARPAFGGEFYYIRGFLIWTLIALSIPVIMILVHRYPPQKNPAVNLPLHLLFSISFIIVISGILSFTLSSIMTIDRLDMQAYFFQNMVWSSLAISTAYWFITGAILLKTNYDHYITEKKNSAALDAELRELQLKLLSEQLRPHFLFNALNSVNSLIFTDQIAAVKSLKKIRAYLNHITDENEIAEITLKEELKFTRLYIDIERERYSDRIQVENIIDYSLQNALVPVMILQPIVENAIRHGIASKREGGKLLVRVSRENGELQLCVEDSGKGLDNLQMIKSEGIGIKNTLNRLNRLYKNNYTCNIGKSDLGGCIVTIRIPLTFKKTSGPVLQENGLSYT